MSITLGIDVGTSGTKTLAIDETGAILASASAEYPCDHPHPGWSEQQPDALVGGDEEDDRPDTGFGSSAGKGHRRNRLERPDARFGVSRCRRRGHPSGSALERSAHRGGMREIEAKAGGREALIRMVANPALTGFTAPKLLWVRKHEPKNWERVRQVLLPKDYVRFRLTGTYATEVSDASGTLLLDVANRRWSSELLSRLGIERDALARVLREPRSVRKSERARGQSDRTTASECPVVGGGGDQPAGAVGNGIVRQGVVSATMGTSGVVFAHADTLGFDPLGRLQRGCHAVPGAWHVMGVVLSAGGSLQWFRNELGKAEMALAKQKGEDPYFILTDEAALAGPGAEGLFFLPYLTGERTPHFDPDAKGAWIGLTVRHGRAHMIRSVMEGATFAMRDSLELIREMGVAIEASAGLRRRRQERSLEADPG